MTVKGCRSFAGIVNFLSLFCPELHKLLKPIYDLTRKDRQFVWGEEKLAFEETKHRLVKQPVFHLPDSKGRFHLYSDTSKFATSSAFTKFKINKPQINSLCK